MDVEKKKVKRQSTKTKEASKSNDLDSVSKEDFEGLGSRLDSLLEMYGAFSGMTNHICRFINGWWITR